MFYYENGKIVVIDLKFKILITIICVKILLSLINDCEETVAEITVNK